MAAIERLWCVVPAAGRGVRLGAQLPKQYVALAGQPLLLWTLQRLAATPRIAGLMVVLAADDPHWPKLDALLMRNEFRIQSTESIPHPWRPPLAQGHSNYLSVATIDGKPVLTAIGAAERSGSVLAGLRALPDSVGAEAFVLVHDAVRPCVAVDDIERLIEAGSAAGGGLLATPLRDTLKLGGRDARVVATEPRESRWRALTPQLFRRGELMRALARAADDGVAITDEAMAMEHAGHRPLLVEGAESNIKVTTLADLALAEFLLRGLGTEG
jgi:2-C-methyl-D-erythritol 4-phosphate cytidylyltransferase